MLCNFNPVLELSLATAPLGECTLTHSLSELLFVTDSESDYTTTTQATTLDVQRYRIRSQL
jgi:hypothetical protein